MEELNKNKFKIAYLIFSVSLVGYLGYCQLSGKRLFESFNSKTQNWSPRGQNGFQHK